MALSGHVELSGVPAPDRDRPKAGRGGAGIDDRTTSLLVVAILAFRVLFTATPFPVLLYQGGPATAPAFTLGMASIGLSAVMIFYAARGSDLTSSRLLPLLVADLVLSCAVGLAGSWLPADAQSSLHAVLWFPFHGTVMLWTVLLGAAWGYASVAAGVGLFTMLFSVEQLGEPGGWSLVLTHAVWLTLPLLVAVIASVLLRKIVRAVLAHGVQVGRSHEQVKMTRTLHDTVLQTLDSMAMRPAHGEATAHERLAELQATAASQAIELRQLLQMDTACGASTVAGVLAELQREFAGVGLRVELVVNDLDGREPDPAVRQAMCEAAREALTNVAKHAGVRKAVVHAGPTEDGVEIIIRDRGQGVDQRQDRPGFGIEQSIVARMREAGGDAEITSKPHRGTRVRLVGPA